MHTSHPEETVPLWFDREEMPILSPLSSDHFTDVCIVGGGIAGLTTAYLLLKEGKQVCLLESNELASGQSGRTTAQFSTVLDSRYFELEGTHGLQGSLLAAQSHATAIRLVESIVKKEKIECDFERVDGYLFTENDNKRSELEAEFEAATRARIEGVEWVNHPAFLAAGRCLKFPHQVQLNPVKYLRGLTDVIIKMGGKIFTKTHVVKIEDEDETLVSTKQGHSVYCSSVVVATHSPINDLFAIHTKQAAYRTYVLAFRVPKGAIAKGLYWDTQDPYHYIRLAPCAFAAENSPHEILIVGGEDHKTGQLENPQDCFYRLEDWARKRFPVAEEITDRWSGQIMEPVDGLAFLGHNPTSRKNIYVITGDSGNGTTHATIGAMIITDQISSRQNPWANLYSPARVNLKATLEFLKENFNVAKQYGDWLESKPSPNLDALGFGEGVVFRDGLKMIAAYKDACGNLEFMSAACPHLAGVVHWNKVEKSWDCPCHGSRFDCHGKVMEGPAFSDLSPIEVFSQPVAFDGLAPLET